MYQLSREYSLEIDRRLTKEDIYDQLQLALAEYRSTNSLSQDDLFSNFDLPGSDLFKIEGRSIRESPPSEDWDWTLAYKDKPVLSIKHTEGKENNHLNAKYDPAYKDVVLPILSTLASATNRTDSAFVGVHEIGEFSSQQGTDSSQLEAKPIEGKSESQPQPIVRTPNRDPWVEFVENRWDRLAIQLWQDGFPAQEIAKEINKTKGAGWKVTPVTVTNRISILRGKYGKNLVPLEKDRRMMLRERICDITKQKL